MLAGDNGLLNQAVRAKENTRGGEVQEYVNLTIAENEMVNYTDGTRKSKSQVIQELYEDGKLTSSEVEQLETEDIITIGSINVDFSKLVDSITLGEVYTDDMIGQELSYTANSSSGYTGKWIVFGKDSSGNILITTELPIDGKFELYGSAEKWLSYEDDLNDVCSVYGGTIQGQTVTSRSITMEDINYVAGFTKPTFDTYTFGSTQDYDNKKVNYYYPSLSASANSYWQNPSTVSTTFQNDWYYYYYYCNWSSGKYLWSYSGADEEDASTLLNTENCQYIWGGNTEDTCYNEYLVASRSVGVYSDAAGFFVAGVGYSEAGAIYYELCYSYASGGYDFGTVGSFGIRPIVILPSSLRVEEQSDGTYDLSE